jgi:uncharacterized protein
MRTDVDHLPPHKQRELERVVKIIFEEFEDLVALTGTAWKKQGRIDTVILYGSYARGGWVDEPHTAKGYRSDFDILIIVNKDKLAERVPNWLKLEERLNRELAITETLKTPVNFIVHSLSEVNNALAQGRYFFMDIARDGIALYQLDDSELHQPRPKTPEQSLKAAKAYFDEWFPAAVGMLETALFSRNQGRFKDAAFLMHQTVERFYNCVLLVSTFYSPHVHNIGFLRTQAERIDRRLVYAWPRDTRKQQAMFEKLKEAYVKARYSPHYLVDVEELDWLSEQIEELGRVVCVICTERLSELRGEIRK